MTYLLMVTKHPTDNYYFFHSPNFPLTIKHKDSQAGLQIYVKWLPALRKEWIQNYNTLPNHLKEAVSDRVDVMMSREMNLEPNDFVNYTNYHMVSV